MNDKITQWKLQLGVLMWAVNKTLVNSLAIVLNLLNGRSSMLDIQSKGVDWFAFFNKTCRVQGDVLV